MATFSGRVWKTNGNVEDFEGLTEEEVREAASLRNPQVQASRYSEDSDTE